MVTSVWEVREAKRMCEEVRRELKNEGIPYSEDVQIGIMIETPAAAINSDRLAKEVDFFSIGTNDLTQYTLACDRQNNDLGRFYDPASPRGAAPDPPCDRERPQERHLGRHLR